MGRTALLRFTGLLLAIALICGCGANPAGPSPGPGGGTNADLQISGAASTASPNAGAPLSYTFVVRNNGADSATAITFTDTLPAGTGFNDATVGGNATACSVANLVVTCSLGALASGGQVTVAVSLNVPIATGTLSNTGVVTATSRDPAPANNVATVTVQVTAATASCSVPPGQTTLDGIVMLKYTGVNGFFENFQFQAGGVTYTVLTNFYDGARPLTTAINLNCREVPVQFIQVANFVNVTGVVGSAMVFGSSVATPVIYASVVQVLTHKDGP